MTPLAKPYSGKILWVDLTEGNAYEQVLPDLFYERFIGGIGLAAAILYRHIPPGADPLGPDNILGFVPGLLTGTPSLFTGRWTAVAKSPLTGTWGEANCGGTFALAIKQCGYDGIFIKGFSPQPVYLFITPSGVDIRNAAHLWGLDAIESEQRLWVEAAHGKQKPSVVCIGAAGEKGSLIAGICHDQGRLAARAGLGAVMGAKNLKAVALAGNLRPACARPDEMKALTRACKRHAQFALPRLPAFVPRLLGATLRKLPFVIRMDGLLLMALFRKWGTVSMNQGSIEWGDAPIKNWAGCERDFPARQSQAINPDRILAYEQRKYHCYACPLGCGGLCNFEGRETHKPEYETTLAFSGLILNTDLPAIFAINDKLNRAGMDSISAGNVVAFAIEAYEKGLLSPQMMDGLELKWGDAQTVMTLLDRMIARQGIGDLLADGVRRAAQRLNNGAEAFAIHAGGQEIAFHDPRLDPGFGLHSSVEPSPGKHNTGAFVYYDTFQLWRKVPSLPRPPLIASKASRYRPTPRQAIQAAAVSSFTQLYNAAGLCLFGAYLGVGRLPLFEWLNAATGWQRTPQEYIEIGRRIQTLRQMFNIRQGIDPRQIKLSPRALGLPPLPRGANRGRSLDLEQMRHDYWQAIGWDAQTGIPTPQTLAALQLGEEDLEDLFATEKAS